MHERGHDGAVARAERFQDGDFTNLFDDEHHERAHDEEACDKDDEAEDDEHDDAFERQRREEVLVALAQRGGREPGKIAEDRGERRGELVDGLGIVDARFELVAIAAEVEEALRGVERHV